MKAINEGEANTIICSVRTDYFSRACFRNVPGKCNIMAA